MNEKLKPNQEKQYCPYCDQEIMAASFPFCKACDVTIFYCPQCRQPVSRDKRECPSCGAEIKG